VIGTRPRLIVCFDRWWDVFEFRWALKVVLVTFQWYLARTQTHAQIHTYTHTNAHILTHAHTCRERERERERRAHAARTHRDAHTYTHTHARAHTHTLTHMYRWSCLLAHSGKSCADFRMFLRQFCCDIGKCVKNRGPFTRSV